MDVVTTLGVIGSGQMGGGIAQIAAQAGIRARVFDVSADQLARCEGMHTKLLGRAVGKGRLTQDAADEAKGNLSYHTAMHDLVDSDWVIEAVSEDAELKKGIFSDLAERFPREDVVLATNTSSISITEIAAVIPGHESRVIGMHFFYPVPVMKLVEVIRGLATSDEVAARTAALAEAMGKTPLIANDRPGFVSNRVLMPMINEAFYALMEGVAEPEAIDGIMGLGCNFPMGPLRLADFIGLDTCANIMDVLADGLNGERYRPCPLLKQYVSAGRLGDKTGRGVYDHSGE